MTGTEQRLGRRHHDLVINSGRGRDEVRDPRQLVPSGLVLRELGRQHRQRRQLRGVGLGGRDALLASRTERNTMVRGLRQRRVGHVRDGQRLAALPAPFRDNGDQVRRFAGLRHADHKRALHPWRCVIPGEQGRRRQRHDEPVVGAKDVLRVAGGVVGRAARRDDHMRDRASAKLLSHARHVCRTIQQKTTQHLWLFCDFVAQHGIGQWGLLSRWGFNMNASCRRKPKLLHRCRGTISSASLTFLGPVLSDG